MGKETIPRHFIYGVIVFMVLLLGGITVLSQINEEDGTLSNSNRYNELNHSSFKKLASLEGNISQIQDTFSQQPDFGLFGALNALIEVSWTTLKTLFNSFGFVGAFFGEFGAIFGLPAWVPGLLFGLIVIMLAFSIFSAFFQKEV